MIGTKLRLRERIQFILERQFVKGAHYQLLAVAAAIGIISVIGGVLVLPLGEPTPGIGESIWWAFLRLTDPGYLGDDVGIWRRFISTLLTLAGYVLFLGSLVAIITTWLNRKIRNLEQGLSPVIANNHVIILGWTNRTVHVVGELFESAGRLRKFLHRHGKRSLKLIILSDDVTPSRLQELKDHRMIGRKAHQIILRSGVAIDQEHLRRVDSVNAAAIILPSQGRSSNRLLTPDIETIKVLLSLNAEIFRNPERQHPLVVAEIQDENKLSAASRAYRGPLEVVAGNTISSRLIAQNIRHMGLSEVYNELFYRNSGNNIFTREYPEWTEQKIENLYHSFPRCVLLGVVRPSNEGYVPFLNQPGDFLIKPGDRLVLLAQNPEDLEEKTAPAPPSYSRSQSPVLNHNRKGAVSKILILGWNHHIPALIQELASYTDEQFEVHIVSLRPIAERERELNLLGDRIKNLQCSHKEADYVKEAELRHIQPMQYDHIILASSDQLLDEEEADARTVVGYILLEEVLKNEKHWPHILLEMSDPSNETLIENIRCEVIIGPRILSHLLAQIALRRELHSIYNELFTVGGAEIIFRKPEEYQLTAPSLRFGELEQAAHSYGETALGLLKTNPQSGSRATLRMNPPREMKFAMNQEVSLVILTST